MNDPRVDAVVAAVESQFPGAQVQLAFDPHPYTARMLMFTILLDTDRERLREAERFALDLTFRTFPGEPVPYIVVAVTPETEAEYQRDAAEELAQQAAAKH
jgi:hypothetical protein